jgi:hypothetical protein
MRRDAEMTDGEDTSADVRSMIGSPAQETRLPTRVWTAVPHESPIPDAPRRLTSFAMSRRCRAQLLLLLAFLGTGLLGCGTTRDKLATEQLLLSDAVDRSVARIDFSAMRGKTVYLDTQYLRTMKVTTVVNADYIISSIRQQMLLAGCLLQDEREKAEFIAEARVGVLGTDGHDVNYGIPAANAGGLSAAATAVGGTLLPSLPEISFARKSDESAAAKVAVFAFRRDNKSPVWQSGTSVARSTAQSRWILGAGPFQSGTIYDGTHFVGGNGNSSTLRGARPEMLTAEDSTYRNPALWDRDLQERLLGNEVPAEMLANRPARPDDDTKKDAAGSDADKRPANAPPKTDPPADSSATAPKPAADASPAPLAPPANAPPSP